MSFLLQFLVVVVVDLLLMMMMINLIDVVDMESPATSSDRSSTGYLQDALLDWSNDDRCNTNNNNKRRRIEEEEFCWDWNFETVTTTSVHKEATPKKQHQHLSSETESNETAKRTRMKEKEMVVGVTVYPFTVVKPGGIDGDVTLDDINKRILRRPTRPIRHPVGEFKCLPSFSVLNGRGLSGKPVVGLTTIHTQGSGTLTIIRTKN